MATILDLKSIIIEDRHISVTTVSVAHPSIRLDLLRLDLVHPVISGNKWFKLKYNLQTAKELGYKKILTFGGAYSNHLIATAAAAHYFGLESIGIVRGFHAKENQTPTLQDCSAYGMQLEFVSKEEYAQKENTDWLGQLSRKHPETYIIPEGGNNAYGVKGCEEIVKHIPAGYTHIAVSLGSGATFTGLRNATDENIMMLGFVPMKNGAYLENEIHPSKGNWRLTDAYHFGGFGKWNNELIVFMNVFYQSNKIPLDVVYTAKMLFGLQELIAQNYFPQNANILAIHTGGLQGNASIEGKLCF